MSMLNVYVLFDAATKSYTSLHTAETDRVAIRGFSRAVNEPASMMHDSPEDFRLMCVGTFDQSTGLLSPLNTPLQVMAAEKVKSGVGETMLTKPQAS